MNFVVDFILSALYELKHYRTKVSNCALHCKLTMILPMKETASSDDIILSCWEKTTPKELFCQGQLSNTVGDFNTVAVMGPNLLAKKVKLLKGHGLKSINVVLLDFFNNLYMC